MNQNMEQEAKAASNAETPVEDIEDSKIPYIPGTYEEYLKWKGLETWPEPILSEKPFGFQVDDIFGSQDDILGELSTIDTRSLFQQLDVFEQKLREFEKRVQPLVKGTFADDTFSVVERKAAPRPTQTEKLVSKYRSQLEERQAAGVSLIPNFLKRLNEIEKQDAALRKYLIEQCAVPKFNPSEFPDLPGHYDAPYLLQVVGNVQRFKDETFVQIWRKVIISDAAIGVLQDIFWWTLIDRFISLLNADADVKQRIMCDKHRFYDRLADSFVALFESINPESRDDIFKVYANFVAQTLYVTFYEAFPDSARFAFRDDFKQYLLDICYELFCGLHAPANGYSKWPVDAAFQRLKVKVALGQTDLSSDATEVSSYLQKELQLPPLPDTSAAAQPSKKVLIETPTQRDGKPNAARSQTSRRARPAESHPVGAAERFRNVLFDTNGRSPLVDRFLQMHRERAEVERPGAKEKGQDKSPRSAEKHFSGAQLLIRHPRVQKISDNLALTYQDVVQTSKSDFAASKRSYQKTKHALEADLKIVNELKRETLERISNLEKELMAKKHSPNAIRDIRLRNELVIAKELKMSEKLEERHLAIASKADNSLNSRAIKENDDDDVSD